MKDHCKLLANIFAIVLIYQFVSIKSYAQLVTGIQKGLSELERQGYLDRQGFSRYTPVFIIVVDGTKYRLTNPNNAQTVQERKKIQNNPPPPLASPQKPFNQKEAIPSPRASKHPQKWPPALFITSQATIPPIPLSQAPTDTEEETTELDNDDQSVTTPEGKVPNFLARRQSHQTSAPRQSKSSIIPEEPYGTLAEVPIGRAPKGRTSTIEITTIPSTIPDESDEPLFSDHRAISNIVNYLGHNLATIIGGSDNYFFSPFSISVALAMAYMGSRGNTAKEMESALGYTKFLGDNSDSQKLHELFNNMIVEVESHQKQYKLLLANGIFTQADFPIRPEFIDAIKTYYLGDLKNLDFINDKAGALEVINNWTSNKTQGKIEKVIEEPLDPLTVMILMNAIYFQGLWNNPFTADSIVTRLFHNTNGTQSSIPFLVANKRMLYFEDREMGYKFVSLLYEGKQVRMNIALPIKEVDPPTLNLTSELWEHVTKNFKPRHVYVKIPKFRLSYERELSQDMSEMGLSELFREHHANLTGMRRQNDLFLSLMIHKAVIEVTEKGTEAAAATGVTFVARSGNSRPATFDANRPFLFSIMHRPTKTTLFTGRVSYL